MQLHKVFNFLLKKYKNIILMFYCPELTQKNNDQLHVYEMLQIVTNDYIAIACIYVTTYGFLQYN